MAIRLSRAELHRLVWEHPMTALGERLSVTPHVLRELCRRHNIPTPPQGHWSKKAHGKAGAVAPLPTEGQAGGADVVVVVHEGATGVESEEMSEARARVRAALGSEPVAGDHQPDPAIERTIAKLQKAKPDRTGLVHVSGKGLITVSIRPDSVDRARQILETLDALAVRAGIRLMKRDDAVVWEAEGETISFGLTELPDRFEHEPTDAEVKAVAKWEAKRQEDFRRYGYLSSYGKPFVPKWEDRYQGRLGIGLEEVRVKSDAYIWGHKLTSSFADSKTRTLLSQLSKVVASIAAIAVSKRVNREVEERHRTREEEAARLRAERERRAAVERRRSELIDKLLGEAEVLHRLARLAADIASEPIDAENHARSARFRRWLGRRIDLMRQERVGALFETRLAQSGLFDDPDDPDFKSANEHTDSWALDGPAATRFSGRRAR